MSMYELIYEDLVGDISLDEAEEILLNRLKLARNAVDDFFAGKPVIKSSEAKVATLQSFLEKSGIKVTRKLQPIKPSEADISHVYKKLLELEEKLDSFQEQAKSSYTPQVSDTIDSISENFKGGLSKASSIANSLKVSGQAKLESLQQEHLKNDKKNVDETRNSEQGKLTHNIKSDQTGYNWFALLSGGGPYYAGYGNVTKGIILAVIAGILPILAIIVAIYGGAKANKELPVRKVPFQWSKFALVLAIQSVVSIIIVSVISLSNVGFSSYENQVRNGTLNFDPSVTISDALDNYEYFSQTEWASHTSRQGRNIVEFSGVMDLDKYIGTKVDRITITDEILEKTRTVANPEVEYILKFSVSKIDDTFEVMSSEIVFSGYNKKEKKEVSKSIPDNNLTSLEAIYANSPELNTQAVILSGSFTSN